MAKASKQMNSAAIADSNVEGNNNDDNNNNSGGKTKKRSRKSAPRDSPQQRSSIFRGVTRHRWTGRYEAHLWDKNCWNQSQNKKGRQVYLGAYDDEAAAAQAYDMAALKYWGQNTTLNFPLSTYKKELKEMEGQSKEEYIGSVRRKSSGFSRGVSKYRGVAKHHHNGRWEARIGRVIGNKYLYLGTYATQEEAAAAYDMAAIEHRGLNAVTNFDLSRYIKPHPQRLKNDANGSEPIPEDSIDISTTEKPSEEDIELNFLNHHQEGSTPVETTGCATATSAVGILLQSPKFKQMLDKTGACNKSPSSDHSEADPPRSSFPEDIQTSFDIQDSCSFAEEHGILFGDYDSWGPVFHFELEA